MQRAAEIAVRFDHTRTDGTDCSTAIPDDMAAYGENIASGYSDYKSVFIGWQETVNILVENQYFGNNAATASPGSYLIDVNESAAAPKAKLSSALAAAGYHFDTAALYPVWTSADTSIAKIENGKVIGVSKGVTYLTGKVL